MPRPRTDPSTNSYHLRVITPGFVERVTMWLRNHYGLDVTLNENLESLTLKLSAETYAEVTSDPSSPFAQGQAKLVPLPPENQSENP